MKVRKGDNVAVIAGKDRGKTGEVLAVSPQKEKVIVKGVNIATHHIKSRQEGKPGERIQKEAPIHVSNVALIDPETKKPTRVGYVIKGTDKIRVSKKSGKEI